MARNTSLFEGDRSRPRHSSRDLISPGLPRDEGEWEALSALYDASILGVDEQIGRIADAVDELGLGDDTIIAFCGDHGEELGEHGNHSHYFLPYEHNIGIPMLYRTADGKSARIKGLRHCWTSP